MCINDESEVSGEICDLSRFFIPNLDCIGVFGLTNTIFIVIDLVMVPSEYSASPERAIFVASLVVKTSDLKITESDTSKKNNEKQIRRLIIQLISSLRDDQHEREVHMIKSL